MKKLNLILAALFLTFAAHAQVLCRWDAESTRNAPARFDCFRGETLLFAPTYRQYGTLVTNVTETFYWQTNGMGSAWWSTNILQFVPAMDVGATSYTCFIRALGTNGVSYRANGIITMRHAPGYIPNALPLPSSSIDFATVNTTNAPWLLPDANYTSTVFKAASAYAWDNHASAGYLHQGESLFITEVGGGVLFPSETDAYALWLSYSGFRDSNNFFIDLPPFSNISQTIATREWTKDFVSTGSPPASAGVPQIWTNMLWGATGTNAIYRMSWDFTNGTFKVEELLP